jgi:hypothetical protein
MMQTFSVDLDNRVSNQHTHDNPSEKLNPNYGKKKSDQARAEVKAKT